MASREAVEIRRRKEIGYLVSGMTKTEIAEKLGITRDTLDSDLKALRKELKAKFDEIGSERDIIDTLEKFEELWRWAYSDYQKAQKSLSTRSRFLRIMEGIQLSIVDLKFRLGLWKSTPEKVDIEHRFITEMGKEERDLAKRSALKALANVYDIRTRKRLVEADSG